MTKYLTYKIMFIILKVDANVCRYTSKCLGKVLNEAPSREHIEQQRPVTDLSTSAVHHQATDLRTAVMVFTRAQRHIVCSDGC